MIRISHKQRGGSAIGTVMILAIFAYGAFVAIQYAPIHIESSAVNSILESIRGAHRAQPFDSVSAVESKINNLLNVNQLNDLRGSFKVRNYRSEFVIDVQYERELNLLFTNKAIPYDKSLTLH